MGDLSRVESLRKLSGLASGFPGLRLRSSAASRCGGASVTRTSEPIAGYRRVGGDALQELGRARAAYPDIRLLERWREVAGRAGGAPAMPRLARRGGRRSRAAGAVDGSARPGIRPRRREDRRAAACSTSTSPDPAWLFVLRALLALSPDPARRPARRGRPRAARLRAVPVPAGKHRLSGRRGARARRVALRGPASSASIAVGLSVAGSAERTREDRHGRARRGPGSLLVLARGRVLQAASRLRRRSARGRRT